MGFIKDTFDAITGKSSEKASREAGRVQSDAAVRGAEIQADAQRESAREGIVAQQDALEDLRRDLSPFVDVGRNAISGFRNSLSSLNDLISNPEAQVSFIQDNPFFKAIADDAQRRIFNNRAAKGKLNSGGTRKALLNQLLVSGNDFLNQGINRLLTGVNANQNAVSIGQSSAARTGSGAVQTGNAISNLLVNSGINAGNAEAGGITNAADAIAAGNVGGANARQQGFTNLLSLGAIALCDRRFKTDIVEYGKTDSGLSLYLFTYAGHHDLMLGPIAQDVEEVQPDAVLELCGVKYVDFARLKCRSIH